MIEAKTKLRQARAALVAEFAFKQRLERIEWEETFLLPELERLKLEIGNGNMPVIEMDTSENED